MSGLFINTLISRLLSLLLSLIKRYQRLRERRPRRQELPEARGCTGWERLAPGGQGATEGLEPQQDDSSCGKSGEV